MDRLLSTLHKEAHNFGKFPGRLFIQGKSNWSNFQSQKVQRRERRCENFVYNGEKSEQHSGFEFKWVSSTDRRDDVRCWLQWCSPLDPENALMSLSGANKGNLFGVRTTWSSAGKTTHSRFFRCDGCSSEKRLSGHTEDLQCTVFTGESPHHILRELACARLCTAVC